jgi:hypothetical protein
MRLREPAPPTTGRSRSTSPTPSPKVGPARARMSSISDRTHLGEPARGISSRSSTRGPNRAANRTSPPNDIGCKIASSNVPPDRMAELQDMSCASHSARRVFSAGPEVHLGRNIQSHASCAFIAAAVRSVYCMTRYQGRQHENQSGSTPASPLTSSVPTVRGTAALRHVTAGCQWRTWLDQNGVDRPHPAAPRWPARAGIHNSAAN